jgi:hypothetical protein
MSQVNLKNNVFRNEKPTFDFSKNSLNQQIYFNGIINKKMMIFDCRIIIEFNSIAGMKISKYFRLSEIIIKIYDKNRST